MCVRLSHLIQISKTSLKAFSIGLDCAVFYVPANTV